MKSFLKKRWHGLPVGIVAILLALVLVAGGALAAAYSFWTGAASVEVMEAVAVGAGTWDNLEPYGSVDDVTITFDEDGITIVHSADTPFVGEGFCPGEWIVIPLNIRNGSDGELTLSASASGGEGNLNLEYLWKTNDGTPVDGDGCCFGYMPTGTWAPLTAWNPTIAGNSGESGSAKVGATVLFVRISVPGNAVPGTYTCYITLGRE